MCYRSSSDTHRTSPFPLCPAGPGTHPRKALLVTRYTSAEYAKPYALSRRAHPTHPSWSQVLIRGTQNKSDLHSHKARKASWHRPPAVANYHPHPTPAASLLVPGSQLSACRCHGTSADDGTHIHAHCRRTPQTQKLKSHTRA